MLANARLVAVMTAFLLTSAAGLLAQESRHEVLRSAADGFPIHITYYPAAADGSGNSMNAPVVILLPGAGESRLTWDKNSSPRQTDPFPVELQKRGYAVIAVDLRKHGESVIPGKEDKIRPLDYEWMFKSDLVAVKGFIYDEHQKQRLNMAKTAVIGSGMSAPLALAFAELDWKLPPYDDAPIPANRTPRGQDVKALILLSPDASAGRVQSSRSLNYLKTPVLGLSLQIIAGSEEARAFKQAESLYQVFEGPNKDKAGSRLELVSPKVADQGLTLMTKDVRLAYLPMLKFLDTNLKGLSIPWQDRRSRLER